MFANSLFFDVGAATWVDGEPFPLDFHLSSFALFFDSNFFYWFNENCLFCHFFLFPSFGLFVIYIFQYLCYSWCIRRAYSVCMCVMCVLFFSSFNSIYCDYWTKIGARAPLLWDYFGGTLDRVFHINKTNDGINGNSCALESDLTQCLKFSWLLEIIFGACLLSNTNREIF